MNPFCGGTPKTNPYMMKKPSHASWDGSKIMPKMPYPAILIPSLSQVGIIKQISDVHERGMPSVC